MDIVILLIIIALLNNLILKIKAYNYRKKDMKKIEIIKIFYSLIKIEQKYLLLKEKNLFDNIDVLESFIIRNSKLIDILNKNLYTEVNNIKIKQLRLKDLSKDTELLDQIYSAQEEVRELFFENSYMLGRIFKMQSPIKYYINKLAYKLSVGFLIFRLNFIYIINKTHIFIIISRMMNLNNNYFNKEINSCINGETLIYK